VTIGDAWQPQAIRIDRVGIQSLVFRPLLQSGNPCKAVCHVRLVEGAKHVVSESGMDSE
jgi:hypothetical protein